MALILVTGSRTWTDRALVAEHLIAARDAVQDGPGKRMALMHGACPRRRVGDRWASADWHAAQVAAQLGWIVLDRPAGWAAGRGAGPARNAAMVAECAGYRQRGSVVVCLAFVLPCVDPGCRRSGEHWTHGAEHCGTEAEQAGIQTSWIRGDR